MRGFPSPLLGVNPDDTYNETPYEKGFCFVSYLAHLVGDQGKFDAFLQVGGGAARGARPKNGVGRHEMLRGEEGLSRVVMAERSSRRAGGVQGHAGGSRGRQRACGSPPRPSPQAYVERFKFQSITADDALNFFLEYFPELKKQGVDSRPGQCGAVRASCATTASPHPWGCRGANRALPKRGPPQLLLPASPQAWSSIAGSTHRAGRPSCPTSPRGSS